MKIKLAFERVRCNETTPIVTNVSGVLVTRYRSTLSISHIKWLACAIKRDAGMRYTVEEMPIVNPVRSYSKTQDRTSGSGSCVYISHGGLYM